jgi:hypothetical protein
MTDTLNSAILKVSTAASISTSPDIGTSQYSFSVSDSLSFTHGTGDNQINQLWTDERTISASSSENLDLYGSLVSALNTTLNFTKIKMIEIVASSLNTNNVLVGGDAASLAGLFVLGGTAAIEDVQLVVPPGGILVLSAPLSGYAVTATTGDILKIANSGGGSDVTYSIKIYGVV